MFLLSTNRDNLIFFFLVPMPFSSLSYITALARISSTMLSRYNESSHPCLAPDFTVNAFHFSQFRMMLAVGLS